MRDKIYRKSQEQKKSYKKFISEMNKNKIHDVPKSKKNKNFNNIDFLNLTEEELYDLEDKLFED